MSRLLYGLIAALARPAVRSGRSKDLEIIVLRHQLAVLRRQNERPELSDDDRTVLAVRTPVANTFAERWIGTLRRELLDRTIIWNQRQVERLVVDFIDHYNAHRPHRSLDQRTPLGTEPPLADPSHLRIVKSTRRDGLINEYQHAG